MSSTDPHDDATDVEMLLSRTGTTPDSAWEDARARFATRAVSEGLVVVGYEDHETPLGTVRVSATELGIVRLILPAEDLDRGLQELAERISPRILRSSTPLITEARRELDEYFSGHRRTFEVALDWSLTTAFRREVLHATAAIPYGETSSYQRVAIAAGSPKAVRAAGSALANNPVPILVPCHRVLRTDGQLGQYRGGTAAKAHLLSHEHAA